MEKGKISALQMAMLLYPAIIATVVLSVPSITAKYAGNDLWQPPIIASVTGFLTVYIAVRLHKLHPGKTVIQYSEDIIGRVPGKIISFFILFFYIHTTGTISRSYSEFIVTSFLFKTPQIVVIGSMVFLCALCIYGGLEVLARATQLLFPFFVLPIIFAAVFLAPDFQIGNIFPVFEKGLMPSIKGAIPTSGWFAEFFLMAFLLPFLADKKKGMKYGMLSVLGVMLSIVLINLIVQFVLGATTANKVYPLMIVGRYANVAGFIENMEAVVMALWIAGAFVKISVFYYAAVLGTTQWLNLSEYRPVVWPLGILIVQLSYWAVPNTLDISRYNASVFPFYSTSIQIFIPLLLLVIALIFKRNKKKAKHLS
ncbi:spore gernimation protein [Siminovitchia acidinfaciens]|uniref:Spore gernimation protein n=1 Tax=Siminovitchia acidinfaciens TaxID=2321395 RepID=A0A429XZY2_9BACI|nr:endospore germination permease [Siminovitchia acidinfaciens]RST74333.1 spore gernimation protein [Siminovitchia acidinfaciens]